MSESTSTASYMESFRSRQASKKQTLNSLSTIDMDIENKGK